MGRGGEDKTSAAQRGGMMFAPRAAIRSTDEGLNLGSLDFNELVTMFWTSDGEIHARVAVNLVRRVKAFDQTETESALQNFASHENAAWFKYSAELLDHPSPGLERAATDPIFPFQAVVIAFAQRVAMQVSLEANKMIVAFNAATGTTIQPSQRIRLTETRITARTRVATVTSYAADGFESVVNGYRELYAVKLSAAVMTPDLQSLHDRKRTSFTYPVDPAKFRDATRAYAFSFMVLAPGDAELAETAFRSVFGVRAL
jgi:hypothetical protein